MVLMKVETTIFNAFLQFVTKIMSQQVTKTLYDDAIDAITLSGTFSQ